METTKYGTSDVWEASAIWASGWPLSHTYREGSKVVFVFPSDGDEIRRVSEEYRRGDLMVRALMMREGYNNVRDALTREFRDVAQS